MTGAADMTGDVGVGKIECGEGTDKEVTGIGTVLGCAGEHGGNGDAGGFGNEFGNLVEKNFFLHRKQKFSQVVVSVGCSQYETLTESFLFSRNGRSSGWAWAVFFIS